MNDKQKRTYLVNIIKSYLQTNIDLMKYYKASATTRKGKYTCEKSIKTTTNALVRLDTIKHTDILEYIYSAFIGNNAIAYAVSGNLVLSNKVKEWDTEEHHQEFVDEMNRQREQAIAKEEERKKAREMVEKAKKEGKQVAYDSKSGKYVIVDEKPKA